MTGEYWCENKHFSAKFMHTISNMNRSIRTHIVHLSAADALPLIQNFRKMHGNRLTVETCHHYLNLSAEEVPKNRVDFKCCPPIRDVGNQIALWNALKAGDIDMVVSDHSPSTAEMKLIDSGPESGNFLKSWGGISSIQFGMIWNHFKKNSLNFNLFPNWIRSITVLDELQ